MVKSLRKSPAAGPGNVSSFPGVVVLAGDISPPDVISHIPVLCEDVNAPYVFVASRAELGAAGSTKRPTSVVMVTEKPRPGAEGGKKDKNKKKKKKSKKDGEGGGKEDDEEDEEDKEDEDEDEDAEDFAEVYRDLVKLVQKESRIQLKFT